MTSRRLNLGDVTEIGAARKMDPKYDAYCKSIDEKFIEFFSSYSSSMVRATRLPNGHKALFTHVGGVFDQSIEDLFFSKFKDLENKVQHSEDYVTFYIFYNDIPCSYIVQPSSKLFYLKLIFGIILMGLAGFLGNELFSWN